MRDLDTISSSIAKEKEVSSADPDDAHSVAIINRVSTKSLKSIREIEERLHSARQWELRPKPTTDQQPPGDIQDQKQFYEKFDLMLSMARLEFESDTKRIITLRGDDFATPPFKLHPDQNTTKGYHNLSQHGQSESKVQQLIDADH